LGLVCGMAMVDRVLAATGNWAVVAEDIHTLCTSSAVP
jgi:hypothetical protein